MDIQIYQENISEPSGLDSPYIFLSLNLSEPSEILEAYINEKIMGSRNALDVQIYLDLLRTDQDYGDDDITRLEQNSRLILNKIGPIAPRCSAFNVQYPFFSFCRELEKCLKTLLSRLSALIKSLKLISYVLKDVQHNHEIIYSLREFTNLQYLSLRFELPADWLVFPCILTRTLQKISMTLTICSLSGYLFKTFDNLPVLEELSLKLIVMTVKSNCLPLTEFYSSNFRSPTLKRSNISFMPFNSPSLADSERESVDPETFFTLNPPLIEGLLDVLSRAAPFSNLELLHLLWCFDDAVDQPLVLRLLTELIALPKLRNLNIDLYQRKSYHRINSSFVGAIKPFLTHPDNVLDKLTITFHKGIVFAEDYKALTLGYDLQRSNVKRYELLFDNVEILDVNHAQQSEVFAEISERFDWMLRGNQVKITGVLRGVLRYFSCRNTFDQVSGDKDFREIYISDTVLRSNPHLDRIILRSLEALERYNGQLSAINLHFDPKGNPLYLNIFRKIDDVLSRNHNLLRVNVDICERTLSIVECHKNLTFLCLMANNLQPYNIRTILGLLKKLPYLTFFDTLSMLPNERNLVRSITQQFFKEKNILLTIGYALKNTKLISRQFKVRHEIKQDLFKNFLMEGLSYQIKFFKGGF